MDTCKEHWVRVEGRGGGGTSKAAERGGHNFAGTSGEVAAGLAGRLGAVLCVLRGCTLRFEDDMAVDWWQCSVWGGRTPHSRAAQAPATSSSGEVAVGLAGRLGAVSRVLCGCIPPFRRHDSRLVAV